MKRLAIAFLMALVLGACADKQQTPVAPVVTHVGVNAFAVPASGTIPFRCQLFAIPYGGVPPYTLWWSHPIQEADSTGDTLTFNPEWAGDFTFIAHVRDATGDTASDPTSVHADPAPAQLCWQDSVSLSVSSTSPKKETTLENPAGLFYILLRITYTCDPRTGFDVISDDGVHTVFEIIDPNPKRSGTETVDLLLPVQFSFGQNQKIAFTFQGGAGGTYAKLLMVTGCTQYPVLTEGVPIRTAQLVRQN